GRFRDGFRRKLRSRPDVNLGVGVVSLGLFRQQSYDRRFDRLLRLVFNLLEFGRVRRLRCLAGGGRITRIPNVQVIAAGNTDGNSDAFRRERSHLLLSVILVGNRQGLFAILLRSLLIRRRRRDGRLLVGPL